MIDLEGVSKNYGPVRALQDISFHVSRNETVGLLGRNGAGKTTLLNLLTGYFPPTAGRVRIAGKDMAEDPASCKRRIGYLPERPPLYDEMTVESYLRFVCELREVKKPAIPPHVDEILSLCGLTEVRGRVLGHLSKGTRQRAGIAQALCGASELLILDEPTAGLDPQQTVEIRSLIRRLRGEHTVIFSSHILSEVQQVCTRVIILEEGRLVTDTGLQHQETGILRLRLAVAGESRRILQTLKSLPGVTAAEKVRPDAEKIPMAKPAPESAAPAAPREGEAEYRLTLQCEAGPGEALDRAFRLLAESGLRVRMMREERETLEEVFLRAVSGQ